MKHSGLWTFLPGRGWEPEGENRKMAISDGREYYRTDNKSRVGGREVELADFTLTLTAFQLHAEIVEKVG